MAEKTKEAPSSNKKELKEEKKKKGQDAMRALEAMATEGGRLVKMEVDYSETCDEKIPLAEKMVKNGQIQEAVDMLMALEKQTRTVSFITNI